MALQIRARWKRGAVLAALAASDMTQAELAERIGVSLQTINRSLTDSREPSLSETMAVASVFGLDVASMTEVVDVNAPRPKYRAGRVAAVQAYAHRSAAGIAAG